ncbi:hypothetical protein JOF56_003272 [Kibdelosporangium banguiense]|uniref:LppX_LprAFG lipoprotein n=1 Tax=Kibdelosporangium banguiense TaxID=1365924 RepID=A0ABS4TEP5_9PSEU|nr:hypothetical protein [Kibdelosporangium banguiense]MBP2322887.1 hypothetical protein [Kibdelosporangium banguiense]
MRKTGLVAASLALALSLTACGSKQAGTPVAGDGTGGGTGGDSGQSKTFDALGLAAAINDNSKAKQSAKIAMTMEAAGQSIKVDGQVKMDANPAMQMTMDMSTMKMEMILIDKVLYMKLPAGMGGGSSTKPWVKISKDGDDPISKQMGTMLDSIDDSFDVGKQMEQLKTAGTITKQEKETLDGEQTTHYWITLDMAKMAQSSDPNVKKAAEDATKGGLDKMNMELWANSDNLPVQITTKMAAMGQNVSMKMTYKDWGKPVTITAPPADQVGEMPR